MDKIGKYRILSQIYTGPTCKVFEAEDSSTGQNVAIKMCLSSDQLHHQRFFREAEISGRLNHPNITRFIGFGFEDKRPFVVLELLTGETLYRKTEQQTDLPLRQKLCYLIDIARAMHHIHQGQVIHRNINPTNVQILQSETAKIMDFSIAKQAGPHGVTQVGAIVGTPPYISPEQITNKPVDHRADIFCFGVLAYELIADQRPFQYNGKLQTLDSTSQPIMGPPLSSVIFSVMRCAPKPIREICPDIPQEIAELVAVCLAKDPENRYAETRDLLRSLEAAVPSDTGGGGELPA